MGTKLLEEEKELVSTSVAPAIQNARDHQLKIESPCLFAVIQFNRNPDYKEMRT